MKTAFFILFLLLSTTLGFCQEDARVELISEFEDYYDFEAFQYVDTLLFVANRYGLFVYSYDEQRMEEPPAELVRYKTRGETESLLIVDTLCYLADGYAGLRILDISDIYNIREVGYCEDATNGQFMQIQDDILYMACGRSYFRSVDVSDPSHPALLQTLGSISDDFRIHGDLVYSASDDRRYMEIIDISDPSNMQTYREVDFGNREDGQGLEIHDDYLYYVTDETFRIVSINDPDNLEVLYEDNSGSNYANAIRYFSENLLYMGCYQIWNVTNPREPEISHRDILYRSSDWTEVGINVSFTCNGVGFYVYDISNLQRLREIQWVPASIGLSDVYVNNDIMYVTSKRKFGSKFDIYNIEDIYHPEKIGEIDSTEGAGPLTWGYDGLVVQDDLAILWSWDGNRGVYIYSVEDPRQPVQIGERQHLQVKEVVADGDYLYLACGGLDGFKIISIADPTNPEVFWEMFPPMESPFGCTGIELSDNYAYVITNGRDDEWERNFLVWDRSNPEEMALLGQCEMEGDEGRIAISNDYAYVTALISNGEGILSVVSVEDGENPELVNTIRLPDYPFDVEVENGFLYISYYKMGFSIYNIENPAEPELLTWIDTPYTPGGFAYCSRLCVRDSYVFLPGMIYDAAFVTGHWNMALSADEYDFGDVYVGSDSTFQLIISNLGWHDVEITGISSDSVAFSVDFNEPFTIPTGADTTIDITFNPTEERRYSGTMTIQTDRRDLTLSLSGNGDILNAVDENLQPLTFSMSFPYPNPFNSTTTIGYSLPVAGNVSLVVYDLSGREVARLVEDMMPAGTHEAVWMADGVSSGVYVVKMVACNETMMSKVILMK